MKENNKLEINQILEIAMLKSNEDEDYIEGLKDVFEAINEIKELEINDMEIITSPSINVNCYDDYSSIEMIDKNEILNQIPNKEGDYVLVPKVIE